jgi:hypothetical protein
MIGCDLDPWLKFEVILNAILVTSFRNYLDKHRGQWIGDLSLDTNMNEGIKRPMSRLGGLTANSPLIIDKFQVQIPIIKRGIASF